MTPRIRVDLESGGGGNETGMGALGVSNNWETYEGELGIGHWIKDDDREIVGQAKENKRESLVVESHGTVDISRRKSSLVLV